MTRTVIAGVLLGIVLAAAVFFLLRPMFGVYRVATLIGLLLSIPIIQVIIHLLKVPNPNAPAPTTPGGVSRLRRAVTFQSVALALPCIAVIAEALAPPQGVVAGIMTAMKTPNPADKLQLPPAFTPQVARTPTVESTPFPTFDPLKAGKKTDDKKRKKDEPKQEEKESTDRELWARADFLLVNPTHFAVGVRDTGLPGKPVFEVLVKGEDKDATEAQKIAWDHKTPVIGIDRDLTRAVYLKYEPSEKLESELEAQVLRLFERRPLVPRNTTLVAYFDTVNSIRRVGHVLANTDDSFEFAELLPRRELESEKPFETEQIVRVSRVQPESEQRDLNDLSLRTSVDFLDYCIYQVLRTIQFAPKQTYQTGEPFVFVDKVQLDISDYEARLQPLKNAREELIDELRRDAKPVTTETLIGVFSRIVIDREEDLKQRSIRDERRRELQSEISVLKEEINQLRALIDAETRLTSEIRSRLVRTGIKQVERSDRAKQAILSAVSGKNWIKPGSEEAVTSNLVQATHLLLTDIRHPERSGRYQLSMRLVDVVTGEILWEDQGDRGELGSAPSYGGINGE